MSPVGGSNLAGTNYISPAELLGLFGSDPNAAPKKGQTLDVGADPFMQAILASYAKSNALIDSSMANSAAFMSMLAGGPGGATAPGAAPTTWAAGAAPGINPVTGGPMATPVAGAVSADQSMARAEGLAGLFGGFAKAVSGGNPNSAGTILGGMAQDMAATSAMNRFMGGGNGGGGGAGGPFGGGGGNGSPALGGLAFNPDRALQMFQLKESLRMEREQSWRDLVKTMHEIDKMGLDAKLAQEEKLQALVQWHMTYNLQRDNQFLEAARIQQGAKNVQDQINAANNRAQEANQSRERVTATQLVATATRQKAVDDRADRVAAESRENQRRIAMARDVGPIAFAQNPDGSHMYTPAQLGLMKSKSTNLDNSDEMQIRMKLYATHPDALKINEKGEWSRSLSVLSSEDPVGTPESIAAVNTWTNGTQEAVMPFLLEGASRTGDMGGLFYGELSPLAGNPIPEKVIQALPDVTVSGEDGKTVTMKGSAFYAKILSDAAAHVEKGESPADVRARVIKVMSEVFGAKISPKPQQ